MQLVTSSKAETSCTQMGREDGQKVGGIVKLGCGRGGIRGKYTSAVRKGQSVQMGEKSGSVGGSNQIIGKLKLPRLAGLLNPKGNKKVCKDKMYIKRYVHTY